MANNKIVYNNQTLIDLTGDDVSEKDVRSGIVFHLPDGTQSEGTLEVGDNTMILTVSATQPSGPNDSQTATVTGYSILDEILLAMPDVVAIWQVNSTNYYVFRPNRYASNNFYFECSVGGITYLLEYTSNVWVVDIVDPTDNLPYENWDFEVDDGQGGLITITKKVFCIDVTQ